jgi:hypothetical protein
MADAQPRARLCLAFPTPSSRGTWDMVRRATAAGIEVEVHRLGEEAEGGRQAEMEVEVHRLGEEAEGGRQAEMEGLW